MTHNCCLHDASSATRNYCSERHAFFLVCVLSEVMDEAATRRRSLVNNRTSAWGAAQAHRRRRADAWYLFAGEVVVLSYRLFERCAQ